MRSKEREKHLKVKCLYFRWNNTPNLSGVASLDLPTFFSSFQLRQIETLGACCFPFTFFHLKIIWLKKSACVGSMMANYVFKRRGEWGKRWNLRKGDKKLSNYWFFSGENFPLQQKSLISSIFFSFFIQSTQWDVNSPRNNELWWKAKKVEAEP